MGSEIYPKVHENPRAFFSSSSPILLEPLAHGSSDWSLPREDCIIYKRNKKIKVAPPIQCMVVHYSIIETRGKNRFFPMRFKPWFMRSSKNRLFSLDLTLVGVMGFSGLCASRLKRQNWKRFRNQCSLFLQIYVSNSSLLLYV